MRIAVLGGAGHMGSATVVDLVASGVSEIVVADYDLEGAKKIADRYRGQKSAVTAQFVDANDHESLVNVMKGADAVASAIGPYFRYGVKVLLATIDAGVNFVDINDDYDATMEALELHDKAKEARITTIIGLGSSPGLTNILAKYGADRLDRVDEIHTAWSTSDGGPPEEEREIPPERRGRVRATVEHGTHMLTGNIPTFRDGKFVEVPAGSEPEIFSFSPSRKIEVVHVGHPEPVTLPRYIEGVKVVTNKGGGGGEGLGTDLVGEKDGKLVRMTLRFVLLRDAEGRPMITPIMRELEGMALVTGAPLSIGAQMLARGDIKVKGVFAPEGCVPIDIFHAEMKKRGLTISERFVYL